jgi:hypothetical protein
MFIKQFKFFPVVGLFMFRKILHCEEIDNKTFNRLNRINDKYNNKLI